MKIHFYHKKSFIAKLIQFVTRSKWNHVSIEFDYIPHARIKLFENNPVFEAIGGRILGVNGILASYDPLAFHSRKKDAVELESIELNVLREHEHAAYFHLVHKVGQPYDYKEFGSHGIRWIKGKENQLVCASLVMEALIKAYPHLKANAQTYSPEDVYKTVKALKAVV